MLVSVLDENFLNGQESLKTECVWDQVITGDLDSSLANLASNLNFGSAKK
jgi:hypothetical protein